jgi:hypothetical protein
MGGNEASEEAMVTPTDVGKVVVLSVEVPHEEERGGRIGSGDSREGVGDQGEVRRGGMRMEVAVGHDDGRLRGRGEEEIGNLGELGARGGDRLRE